MKKASIMVQSSVDSVITPQVPFSESELLEGLTPGTAHADEVAILTD